ncbi:MAG: hypothetical protein ACK5PQ_04540 [Alphaproteobacteria bacterium]
MHKGLFWGIIFSLSLGWAAWSDDEKELFFESITVGLRIKQGHSRYVFISGLMLDEKSVLTLGAPFLDPTPPFSACVFSRTPKEILGEAQVIKFSPGDENLAIILLQNEIMMPQFPVVEVIPDADLDGQRIAVSSYQLYPTGKYGFSVISGSIKEMDPNSITYESSDSQLGSAGAGIFLGQEDVYKLCALGKVHFLMGAL